MREDETPNLALSPDGRTLVYTTAGMLYKRALSSETGEPIPGTELAFYPFFSPDGQSIAFTQDDAIRRVSINGGPVTRVTGGSDLGADWGDDDTIVSTTRGALWRTPASGGASKQVTTLAPGEAEHLWPQAVPGSRVLIFTVLGNTGLWSDARVVALDLASGRRTVIREQATYGRFVPPNHVVYVDATGTVSAIRFDLGSLTTRGDPVSVESGINVGSWGGAASLAVSQAGTMAFARGTTLKSSLVWWVDRGGQRRQLGDAYSLTKLQITPDQRSILTDPFVSSALDVYMMDASSGARDRVTFVTPGTFSYEAPVLSPDGRRIAYAFQVNNDSMRVRTVAREGGADSALFTLPHHHHLQDWSPDGTWLLSELEHPERRSDLIAVRIDSVGRRVAVAETPAVEHSGRFSPDGRWVAYNSNESGRDEVYVVSFPAADVRRQVSTDGGRFPRWSRTGGELFYWRDSTLMAARVTTAGDFQRGQLTPLFTMGDADPAYERWDVATDGRRFLIAGHNPATPAREIHVVLNWNATLTAKERK
jgi:Tol biopolymer transport system component